MDYPPREIGTLIVIILKARNLPNKRHIGKQAPYCTVEFNGEKRRTKAIRRGGQHPEWDEELRFVLLEEPDAALHSKQSSDGIPPPPPPKRVVDRKIQGGKKLNIACFADDPKEPELVGEAMVDLTEVLTKGETDEWFTLMSKEKYCGEVYLELTFWSNDKPPEKRQAPQVNLQNPNYGGPGSFTPSSLHGIQRGSSDSEDTPSPSQKSYALATTLASTPPSYPPSLLPTSSLAHVNLYSPSYECRVSPTPSIPYSVSNLTNDLAELGVRDSSRHGDSYQGIPDEVARYSVARTPSIPSIHSISSNSSFQYSLNGYRPTSSSGVSAFSFEAYPPLLTSEPPPPRLVQEPSYFAPPSEAPWLSAVSPYEDTGRLYSSTTPSQIPLFPNGPGFVLPPINTAPSPLISTSYDRSPLPRTMTSLPSQSPHLPRPPLPPPPSTSAPPLVPPHLRPPHVPPIPPHSAPIEYPPRPTAIPPKRPSLPPPPSGQLQSVLSPSHIMSRPLPDPHQQSSLSNACPPSGTATQLPSQMSVIQQSSPARQSVIPFQPPPPPPPLPPPSHISQPVEVIEGQYYFPSSSYPGIQPPPPPPPLPNVDFSYQNGGYYRN